MQENWRFHHLQSIISLKDSQNLEHVRCKVFDRCGDTQELLAEHQCIGTFSLKNSVVTFMSLSLLRQAILDSVADVHKKC